MPGDFNDLFDDDYASTKSGVLEVLPEGWGFLRQRPGVPSHQDIYVAQAHVHGGGLKSGDVIKGQVRPPKETERFSSLLRIQSINGESYSFP